MMKFGKTLSLLLLCSVATVPSWGGDTEGAVEGYSKTGEVANCVTTHRIRRTDVLDNQHILFKMRNGQTYMNTLSHKCSSLGFYESFSYKIYGSQLCSVDTISVLTGGSTPGPTCGLGAFEEVEKDKVEDAA